MRRKGKTYKYVEKNVFETITKEEYTNSCQKTTAKGDEKHESKITSGNGYCSSIRYDFYSIHLYYVIRKCFRRQEAV